MWARSMYSALGKQAYDSIQPEAILNGVGQNVLVKANTRVEGTVVWGNRQGRSRK